MILFDKETAHAMCKRYQRKKSDKEAADYLGKIVLKIHDVLKKKRQWINYHGDCADLMRGEAIYRMSLGLKTWTPEKSTLYTYLMLICTNAFKGMVKWHKYKLNNGRFAEEIHMEEGEDGRSYDTVGTVV